MTNTINNTIVTRKSVLLSALPTSDITPVQNGKMVIYSPLDSETFMPLLLSKKDGNILVTPQDDIAEDTLLQLFSDESFSESPSYKFNEKDLVNILGDDVDYLCSIVAFLETYESFDFIDDEKFIKLLVTLKATGYGISTIMLCLEKLDKTEFMNLCTVFDEMPDATCAKFRRLITSQAYNDEDVDE